MLHQHTPGDWGVDPDSAHHTGNMLVKVILGSVICESDPLPEAPANACLIVAAPAIYAALLVAENAIRGVLMFETPGSAKHEEHQRVLSFLHKALASAIASEIDARDEPTHSIGG